MAVVVLLQFVLWSVSLLSSSHVNLLMLVVMVVVMVTFVMVVVG